MTLDEVEQWCKRATKALLLEGGLEAAPAVFWEFAALDVGPVTYQHLLFEFSRMHDESDWSLSFTRQAWFDDEDEPEIFGFSWRIAPPNSDTATVAVSRFGAREGEVCDWEGDWLPWDAFRTEVERDVLVLWEVGCRLVADLMPAYTPSVPVAVDPERERERSLVIDVDDPATWTRHIREWAGLWIPELDDSSAVMADLELPGGAEDELRSILHNSVLAFNCTRLLPYEVESVRERGLRVLSPRRMKQRILDACGNGFLTDSQVADLLPQIAPPAEEGGREAMLAFLLGRTGLDEPEASGALTPLSRWGSEGLNAQAEDPLGALSIGARLSS